MADLRHRTRDALHRVDADAVHGSDHAHAWARRRGNTRAPRGGRPALGGATAIGRPWSKPKGVGSRVLPSAAYPD
jgi:hypothetical protein